MTQLHSLDMDDAGEWREPKQKRLGRCPRTGKIAFPKLWQAQRKAEHVAKGNATRRKLPSKYRNRDVDVYRCPHCGDWHMTRAGR